MNADLESALRTRIWIARALIGVVAALNLQAAVAYLINPRVFSAGFELSGVPGAAAVAGVGILYLMWQVPYLFALINPARRRISLLEAILMQTIGLIGESWLLGTIGSEHAVLRASIIRYIVFDGGGLVLLAAAFFLVKPSSSRLKKGDSDV